MEYFYYILLVLSTAILVSLSVIYIDGWKRTVILLLFVFNLFLFMFIMYNIFGKPLVSNFLTKYMYRIEKAEILWFSLNDNKNITLLISNGNKHPIYLVIPWDQKSAEKLQEIKRKQENGDYDTAEGTEGKITIKKPFSLETRDNDIQHETPPKTIEIPKIPQQKRNIIAN